MVPKKEEVQPILDLKALNSCEGTKIQDGIRSLRSGLSSSEDFLASIDTAQEESWA